MTLCQPISAWFIVAWSSRPPFCLSYFTCSFLPQGLCTCHFLYLAHSSLLFAKVTPTPLLLSFQHPSYNLALTGRPSWVDSPCHRLSLLSTVLDWFEWLFVSVCLSARPISYMKVGTASDSRDHLYRLPPQCLAGRRCSILFVDFRDEWKS